MEYWILANQSPRANPIYPSLLSADSLRLGEEVSALIHAGIDTVHLDIMDNHYVPNLTFGPGVARSLRQKFPKLNIDVHLMTTPVDALITQFAEAGASRISIHPDATIHLDRSLDLIQSHGCQAGLVLNPSTSLDVLTWCMHRIDFVLIMTVNPGFGGQSLIPSVIMKIKRLREIYPALPLCVDGGVNSDNITSLAKAGATQFIMGSAFFKEPDYVKTITSLRQALDLID